jgi:putative tryptophan/tyrosine transport system substrate-binding protein
MRRRDFIVVLGSAATSSSLWSRKALGQQNSKVHHIGYLGLGPAATSATRVDAFLAGLRDLGYVEGKTLVIEFRWGTTQTNYANSQPSWFSQTWN